MTKDNNFDVFYFALMVSFLGALLLGMVLLKFLV
jgi:hypothetical protein